MFRYSHTDDEPHPYVSGDGHKVMDLLLLILGENKHYLLEKEFDRFMNKYNKNGHRKQSCRYCLQPLSSAIVVGRHLGRSKKDGLQAMEMPEKDSILMFETYRKHFKKPSICNTRTF